MSGYEGGVGGGGNNNRSSMMITNNTTTGTPSSSSRCSNNITTTTTTTPQQPPPQSSSSSSSSSSTVSLSIRSEIHRFESVHPSIYSIYELLDQVVVASNTAAVAGGDSLLAVVVNNTTSAPGLTTTTSDNDGGGGGGSSSSGLQQVVQQLTQAIREHVVNIEDCFVNSQEWTLSRTVSELHIGLLGSQLSPKSTLVHRYLTSQYVQDNSPEGGRFKKEIILSSSSSSTTTSNSITGGCHANNTPYLLLLRDEGGPPELQFSHWADALILIASSPQTTNTCFSYITRFANYRSLTDLPIILVSVQEDDDDDDADQSHSNNDDHPPYIQNFRKIPHTEYFHCNVRTGLNVDTIFRETCNLIINHKKQQAHLMMPPPPPPPPQAHNSTYHHGNNGITTTQSPFPHLLLQRSNNNNNTSSNSLKTPPPTTPRNKEPPPVSMTTTTTPTTSRKSRRRSNLFNTSSSTQPITTTTTPSHSNSTDLGSGRTIPIKQATLLKKSNPTNSKITNKKWKKKYVTLSEGKLEYFDTINQYMDNPRSGKVIELKHVTVKVTQNSSNSGSSSSSSTHHHHSNVVKTIADSLSTLSLKKSSNSNSGGSGSSYNVQQKQHQQTTATNTYGFKLISISKQWEFETICAPTPQPPPNNNKPNNSKEDRDDWISLIEEQIVKSLQASLSNPVSSRRRHLLLNECGGGDELGCGGGGGGGLLSSNKAQIDAVKEANPECADCGALLGGGGGYWASLNLCVVVCIGCSGVHRNLGSHVSKVRSLELDVMSTTLLSPLLSIKSNKMANEIYEAALLPSQQRDNKITTTNTQTNTVIKKPTAASTPEERSTFIRRKYESLDFLPNSINAMGTTTTTTGGGAASSTTMVTQDMVEKSISEKDFWTFLLYVNLDRRDRRRRGVTPGAGVTDLSSSTSLWSDGRLLNLAMTKTDEFTPAGQVILWMTNDDVTTTTAQQRNNNQVLDPPNKQQQHYNYQPHNTSAATPGSSSSSSVPTRTTTPQQGMIIKLSKEC